MPSVWVIEQGSYSDYRVVGVFSSKENAALVLAALDDTYGGPTIAEWPLDPAVTELRQGFAQFNLLMLRDGTVERIDRQQPTYYCLHGEAHIWRRSTAPPYKGTGKPDVMQAIVWARDEEHAIKIANERRTQMIASGEWK